MEQKVKKEKETAAGDEARAALVMALIVLPYPVINKNDATTMRAATYTARG